MVVFFFSLGVLLASAFLLDIQLCKQANKNSTQQMPQQCIFLLEILKGRSLSANENDCLGSAEGDAPTHQRGADIPTAPRGFLSLQQLLKSLFR